MAGHPFDPVLATVYRRMGGLRIAGKEVFFDTLSRYFEILVADEGYRLDGMRGVEFPTGVPELIARDRRLVELIVAGRFDFIMNLGDEYQEWLDRVRSA
ncbi:hypothetical protein F0U61_05645 [Archangium violaceum]|uniref:hypothetical protein n=1 Tax=Archangium violaceum TaxID=83451 RepID=UPI002B2D4947|nr:hypothetical protein F0U61_05645 [Archangium violaceum]